MDEFIQKVIAKYNLTITVAQADPTRTDDKKWGPRASHWRVTIRKGKDAFRLKFHQGAAHTNPPTLADVLECVISDSRGYEDNPGYEAWAGEYGYGEDGRSTYAVVKKQAERLETFFGGDYQEIISGDLAEAE